MKNAVQARNASSVTADDDQKYSLGVIGNAVALIDGSFGVSSQAVAVYLFY